LGLSKGVGKLIREVIVVEGKDDITAVKAAVDAEVIATGGFAYSREFIRTLQKIGEKRGIIILTDPDYAGEQIRRDLAKHLKNCKHAFLPQGKALRKGDIGVENAAKDDIIRAIEKARPSHVDRSKEFTKKDLIDRGLSGGPNSREKRESLGETLGIGYSNSKQLLNRLNNFGIGRQEFELALERIEKEDGR